MAGLSAADKAAILNAHLRGGTYTGEATLYIGLHTGDPGVYGLANELAYAGYVRQAITFLAADATGSYNDTEIVFPAPTTNQGTISHYSIHSASTGGAFRHAGTLTGDTLDASGVPTIAAVALLVTL